MRPRLPAAAAALLTAAAAALHASPAAAAEPAPVDAVRPFVGTQNFGNTFPGAAAPFGMVQVSPDTGGQGGYDWTAGSLYGFSQTHLSGVGCGVAGELPVMPTTGAVTSVDPNVYRSPFSLVSEPGESVPSFQVPCASNGRSKVAEKYVRWRSRPAQKPPEATQPSTVRSPTTLTLDPCTAMFALAVLKRTLARVPAGKL